MMECMARDSAAAISFPSAALGCKVQGSGFTVKGSEFRV